MGRGSKSILQIIIIITIHSKVGQLAHSLRRDKSLVSLCTTIALSCLLSVGRSFSLLCKTPDLERLLVVLRFLLSTVPHPKCITLQVLSSFRCCGSTMPFELKTRLQDTGSHFRLHYRAVSFGSTTSLNEEQNTKTQKSL